MWRVVMEVASTFLTVGEGAAYLPLTASKSEQTSRPHRRTIVRGCPWTPSRLVRQRSSPHPPLRPPRRWPWHPPACRPQEGCGGERRTIKPAVMRLYAQARRRRSYVSGSTTPPSQSYHLIHPTELNRDRRDLGRSYYTRHSGAWSGCASGSQPDEAAAAASSSSRRRGGKVRVSGKGARQISCVGMLEHVVAGVASLAAQ